MPSSLFNIHRRLIRALVVLFTSWWILTAREASAVEKQVTLIEMGDAKTAIYAPAEVMAAPDSSKPSIKEPQTRARLRASVQDLASCLEKMSGVKIPVLPGQPPAKSKTFPILIGDLASKKFGGPGLTTPHRQAFRLVVSRQGIGCIGESDESTSYAIYEMLDRLGCRWYVPGDLGEHIPRHSTVKLPLQDFSGMPGTLTRNIWYTDEDFRRHSRLGGIRCEAGHALETYVTKDLLEKHPDWNAEIGGNRSINGRICWGNPEVAQAIAKHLSAYLDANPTVTSVSLSPGDGIAFCECVKCQALDAGDWDSTIGCVSITDRYIHFCNQIAEEVTRKHPQVVLGMLAYVQFTRPPLREKVHPNIIPVFAPITYCRAHSMANPDCPSRQELRKIVQGWGKCVKNWALYEYAYNLAEVSAPNPMMTKWSEDLPLCYQSGLTLWTPETMPNFASVTPGLYLGIRMSWQPKADPREILNDFFAHFYGASEVPMRNYWQTIDDAWSKPTDHAGCGFSYLRRFTPEIMKAGRQALDEAAAAAQTALEARRIQLAADAFEEFEIFMSLRRKLAAGNLAALQPEADRWLHRWDWLMARHPLFFSPYGASYFRIFFGHTYKDADRIARDFQIVARVPNQWRYRVDKEKQGDALGWAKSEFDDPTWKTTDVCVETWDSLGLAAYYGPVWYRSTVRLGAIPSGKKVFLWIASMDGKCKVFVNGQHAPFVNAAGQTLPESSGYAYPASHEITGLVRPQADNAIGIIGTRTFLNELGTGGLLGPVVIYAEK